MPFTLNLMMWSGDRAQVQREIDAELAKLDERERKLEENWAQVQKQAERRWNIPRDRASARQLERDHERQRRNYEYAKEEIAALREYVASKVPDEAVGFQPHQLLTHAVLHGDLLHLAGNLLFLLVFGLRVNELLGNLRTAIVYPVLAVASGLLDMWATQDQRLTASLGASGAIAGLAGMYLVFFPIQRVRMIEIERRAFPILLFSVIAEPADLHVAANKTDPDDPRRHFGRVIIQHNHAESASGVHK